MSRTGRLTTLGISCWRNARRSEFYGRLSASLLEEHHPPLSGLVGADLRGSARRPRHEVAGAHAWVLRDFVAVAAFLRWCADARQISVPAINLPREKEN